MVMGWNAPNRLVIGRNVMPGQEIQLAIFGINGPISQSPTNYIFMRYARLEFYPGGCSPAAVAPREVNVRVLRLDPSLDDIVPKNPKLFKLAEGFTFVEGPVWQDGSLLFSDPNENRIYRYLADGRLFIFRRNSGYAAADIDRYRQPGSNGLTLDAKGHLTISEHGNRRITRLENDGSLTVLADRYSGKRLNSPNDLVFKSDGSLYFTDPPFGLPGMDEDPKKELEFSGIFRLKAGKLELLSRELKGPNGIAFSPDEQFLYVGNWDPEKKVVMRYPVLTDGALGNGEVFFDMTPGPHPEAIDGIKVDVKGNVYVSGPGGMWILSAAGKHLGTVIAPRPIHNFAWGGNDGKSLYLTATDKLYRMPLMVEGIRPK
jgi:gluconolactonase